MHRILNETKCSICREILESPVILPCNDNVCKKHTTNQSNEVIRCEKCGVEHRIPTNGFQSNQNLQEIIVAKIGHQYYFLDSKIINENSIEKLEDLLKKKELNGLKWSLLYQGSRDGFGASDFHFHCDGKSNTLTIVKSTLGNIFGGYTSLSWESPRAGSWKYDASAYILSIVNYENRPLIFEHSTINRNSVQSVSGYGPIFGFGIDFDMIIFNNSNTNTKSHSHVGSTYIHPEYPYGSEKAKKILAGSYNFQVEEFEVFQMQQ